MAYQKKDYHHLLLIARNDDVQIVKAIKQQLPNHSLFICHKFHELLEILENIKIDIIIAGNQEGEISNFDILKLSREKIIDIPVMYVARKRDSKYIREEILSSFNGYIMESQILKLRTYLDIMWVNLMAKKAIESHEKVLSNIKARLLNSPYYCASKKVTKAKIVA